MEIKGGVKRPDADESQAIDFIDDFQLGEGFDMRRIRGAKLQDRAKEANFSGYTQNSTNSRIAIEVKRVKEFSVVTPENW